MGFPLVQILGSDRVSPQTRAVLEERARAVEGEYAFFSEQEAVWMEALAEAVLPQGTAGAKVPLVKMIDERISRGEGDGWRYASEPADGEAYRMALRCVREEVGEADGDAGTAWLERVARKELDVPAFRVSRWLEEMKVEVTKYWLASYAGMAAIGYDGFADDRLTAADVAPNVAAGGGR